MPDSEYCQQLPGIQEATTRPLVRKVLGSLRIISSEAVSVGMLERKQSSLFADTPDGVMNGYVRILALGNQTLKAGLVAEANAPLRHGREFGLGLREGRDLARRGLDLLPRSS